MLTLGPLGFAAPWALAALPLLPALWWWLRRLPPQPQTVSFPAIRLLAELPLRDARPAQAPWWLLLIRLLILAALLLALARPVLHPAGELSGHAPLVIVVDNGWAAASQWPVRLSVLQEWIARAERDNRLLAVATTAPPTSADASADLAAVPAFAVVTAAEARRWAEALHPQPWPGEPAALLPALAALAEHPAFTGTGGWFSVWLSDGLKAPGSDALLSRLRHAGEVVVVSSPPEALPHALAPGDAGPRTAATGLPVRLLRADARTPEQIVVRILADDGRLLGRETVTLAAGQKQAEATLPLPPETRTSVAAVRLEHESHAAAVALLDSRWHRRPVGFPAESHRSDPQPYTSETYFLERALAPFYPLRHGTIPELLAEGVALILAADVGAFADADVPALLSWIEDGGVMVRFAGPRLAGASLRTPAVPLPSKPVPDLEDGEESTRSHENTGRRNPERRNTSPPGFPPPAGAPLLDSPRFPESRSEPDPLLPVRLRPGERQLGGALSWAAPARLAPFLAGSPLQDLPVTDDIRVTRQVLAEPEAVQDGRVWATLEDGTPLITARPLGRGWQILVHTTANTAWSNFALSGVFVQVLQRLADLSEGLPAAGAGDMAGPAWEIQQMVDGHGQLVPPPADTGPVPAARFADLTPGSRHPPGLYRAGTSRRALNLGHRLALTPLLPLPDRFPAQPYQTTRERDLQSSLLLLALLLLAVDGILTIRSPWKTSPLRTLLRWPLPKRRSLFLLGLVAGITLTGGSGRNTLLAADTPHPYPEIVWKAAQEVHLAYVLTGEATVDALSRAGLRALARLLKERTAVEPAEEPVAIQLGHDVLAVYPLLYWPITETQTTLREPARIALADFLRNGGTLLLDTRDQGQGLGDNGGPRAGRLARLLRGIDLPPLIPLPTDHVLGRSFYLLNSFPGRTTGGTVWVESREARNHDGVSSLILGSHDWAAAWAHDENGHPVLPVIPGGEGQREQALRFGINLVMYALSGNYKADQVHVPALLERLGQ